jgi:uncharacterized protein (UPF0548 family)
LQDHFTVLSNIGYVFRLHKPTEAAIQEQIVTTTGKPAASPRFLSIEDGLHPGHLGSYSHDRSKSSLGHGEAVFAAAKLAFAHWQMFDLGWTRMLNTSALIACGQVVAVEVHSLGLWSVNLSLILETVDSGTRFGFLYSTTAEHVEQGEETFVLNYDPATGEVSYELEAVSRPRHVLAKLGYPVTRFFQHRFARDSHSCAKLLP